jgi:hypothetical protein
MSLLLSLLIACAPKESAPAPLDARLGAGEWEWEGLEDGDEIPVIQGPQGGFHILGSVRVSGVEPGDPDDLGESDNPTTTFFVWVNGENLAPVARYVQGLDPVIDTSVTDFSHEMIGRFAILDIDADDELDGVELTFEVVVEDVHGDLVSDSLSLVAYPHPYNL